MLNQKETAKENEMCLDRSGTFRDVAWEWFAAQKTQWKMASTIKYRNILENYLLPTFGEKQISAISRAEVVVFESSLMKDGGVKRAGLSAATVMGILSVMKNIFIYAGQIDGYMVADLSRVSIKQSQKPMRILSRSEQERLSTFLCAQMTPCNLGILICLYTGIRIGEICALQWGDISFEEQYLHIHRTMQRLQTEKGEQKTIILISAPKSDCSIRRVPIPDVLIPTLKKCRQAADAYVLTGRTTEYMEPRTLQNRFKTVIRQCEIEYANFHALRHTFATRCVELGFDMKSLSEILGHASVNITLNRYVHPSMELKQKNMNMLSELLRM